MNDTRAGAARRAAIMAAAQRLFAQFGFSKVTMDDIAREVGMAKASLYYYYAAKEDVYRAVIVTEQDELLRRADALASSEASASAKLVDFADLRFAYFRTVANLSRLSYLSLIEMKPIFGTLHADLLVKEQALLTRIIDDGVRRGEFRLRDADAHARLFLHSIQGLRARLFRELARTASAADDAMYEALHREMRLLAQVFARAFCAGLDTGAPAEGASTSRRGATTAARTKKGTTP